jgi:hypothetical protein
MTQALFHIYDKIFKKILTLSAKAVVNMINGLFGTEYPTDSTVSYNWTEFEDRELKRILADTIITINGRYSYHMEAQMTLDDNIVFRVFDYGYSHASINSTKDGDSYILPFPEPKILYFGTEGEMPESYTLTLDFGTQGTFDYRVPVFNYLNTTPAELTQKKLIILIPFELLRLRDIMKRERSPENREALKSLIQNDIIGSIEENLRVGNITDDDARRLKRLTHKLYMHIYSRYEELEDITMLTDESLMLDIDIIEKKHEKELAEKNKAIVEIIAQKDAEMSKAIAEKDQEILLLKKQLEKYLAQ